MTAFEMKEKVVGVKRSQRYWANQTVGVEEIGFFGQTKGDESGVSVGRVRINEYEMFLRTEERWSKPEVTE